MRCVLHFKTLVTPTTAAHPNRSTAPPQRVWRARAHLLDYCPMMAALLLALVLLSRGVFSGYGFILARVAPTATTATATATTAASSAPSTAPRALSSPIPSSVYVNLPFCRRRCFYCDFPIKVCVRQQVVCKSTSVTTAAARTTCTRFCQHVNHEVPSTSVYKFDWGDFQRAHSGGGTMSSFGSCTCLCSCFERSTVFLGTYVPPTFQQECPSSTPLAF